MNLYWQLGGDYLRKLGEKKYTLKYTACKILNHKKTGETDNLSMLTSESRPAFLCMIHFDFIFPQYRKKSIRRYCVHQEIVDSLLNMYILFEIAILTEHRLYV